MFYLVIFILFIISIIFVRKEPWGGIGIHSLLPIVIYINKIPSLAYLFMDKRIIIEPADLEEERPLARKIIIKSGITELFREIDAGFYGGTIEGIKLAEILETSLSLLMECDKQLTNIIHQDRGEGFARVGELSERDRRFVNLFSTFVCTSQAIEEISPLSDLPIRVEGSFKRDEVYSLIKNSLLMSEGLLKDFYIYLKFQKNHPSPERRLNSAIKTLQCSFAYFKLLQNTLNIIVKDSEFEIYRKSLEQIKINILGKLFEGFSYRREDFGDDNQLIPIKTDDIIGNEDYVKAGLRLARDVAGFDFESGENPKKFNPILFALGNPGCGKTATAHALGNFFLDFCKEKGIPSRFVIIRRTDWASSYQNASADQLIKIFKKNVLGYKGVAGIYWPDIDTAFAARGDSIRDEEKNILGAVFGIFDGTILPKNGQWFMLCDANFMNMDEATISRITQDPYTVKGPEKPEDYIKLFRDVKLREHKGNLALSQEEWTEFGKLCMEYGFSGRGIENISRKTISIIEDFNFPEEYYKLDLAGKKEIIRKLSKTISWEDVRKLVEHYSRFEKEAEEKSAQKRFDERVKEITGYLSAKKTALESFLKMTEES